MTAAGLQEKIPSAHSPQTRHRGGWLAGRRPGEDAFCLFPAAWTARPSVEAERRCALAAPPRPHIAVARRRSFGGPRALEIRRRCLQRERLQATRALAALWNPAREAAHHEKTMAQRRMSLTVWLLTSSTPRVPVPAARGSRRSPVHLKRGQRAYRSRRPALLACRQASVEIAGQSPR